MSVCLFRRVLAGYSKLGKHLPPCDQKAVEGSVYCAPHRREAWMRFQMGKRKPVAP